MQCLQQFGKPTGEFVQVELNDDGSYLMECMHGHKSETLLQQDKFEILFDIGAYAILDGYYREAVSSFASSLERFYEFCIRVISKRRDVNKDTFEKAWKLTAKQSERQLGAFMFLWVTEFAKLPVLLSDKRMNGNEDMVKFRNRVIHEGKIPNREEAIKFGNAVLEVLRPQYEVLCKSYVKEIRQITTENLQKASRSGRPTSTMYETTVIGFKPDHHSKSLEEALKFLIEKRRMIGALCDEKK
jgi:hypothetical protein